MPRTRPVPARARLPLRSLWFLPLIVLGSGGLPAPSGDAGTADGRACAADLSFPLEVTVVPAGVVRPGAPLEARVEVTSRLLFDDVQIRLVPSAGVTVLSTPAVRLGLLRAGEVRQTAFTVIPGGGAVRRTVEVVVDAFQDGQRLSTGAVLNLVFEEEARRTVTDADGTPVVEVGARRIR